jgi:hypothetical protein
VLPFDSASDAPLNSARPDVGRFARTLDAQTTKRIIFSEARGGGGYGVDSSKHNYLLLILAVIQFPLHMWLGAAFA